MKFFVLYRGKVSSAEVPEGSQVGLLKELLRHRFSLQDVEHSGDKKLTLSYNTTCLKDDWVLSDVGIPSGSTLHFFLTEEKSPSLRIICSFSGETVNLYEALDGNTHVSQLKRLVMNRTGVPYSVFRLSFEGNELFDCHSLGHYGISPGSSVKMETWDGWNNFLNAARCGYAKQVADNLMQDDIEVLEYQRRVALFMAAHFGYTDLAARMLRMGVHADEPVGEHPARRWCADQHNFVLYTTPVHEAAINGHLPVLRLFVRNSSACVAATDGNGLTPLSLAIAYKRIDCVTYLKQQRWRKGKTNEQVSHAVFTKMRNWGKSIRAKALASSSGIGGQESQSRHYLHPPMVGSAIYVDGLHESMQKTRHEISHSHARDATDSECEQSAISSHNSGSQIGATEILPSLPSNLQQLPRHRRWEISPKDVLPPICNHSSLSTVTAVTSGHGQVCTNRISEKESSIHIVHHLPHVEMIEKTKSAYEQYSGKSTHDSVLACMDIASSFSSKPWLSQVRLAMSVHKNAIQRPLRPRSKSEPTSRNVTRIRSWKQSRVT